MKARRRVFAIIGSAGHESANLSLVRQLAKLSSDKWDVDIFDRLGELPHFDPDLSLDGTPQAVLDFRKAVMDADGVIICTPEYVFSIPSRLKNAIEWCVATTVFSGKPAALITASASGVKAQEELILIMKTIEANVSASSTLLIQGIRSKFDQHGQLSDPATAEQLKYLIASFQSQMATSSQEL